MTQNDENRLRELIEYTVRARVDAQLAQIREYETKQQLEVFFRDLRKRYEEACLREI